MKIVSVYRGDFEHVRNFYVSPLVTLTLAIFVQFSSRPICYSFVFMQIALQTSLTCTKNKKNLNLQRGLEDNLHVQKRITNRQRKSVHVQ